MKFLFEVFPVALFFAAILAWDIFFATGVAISPFSWITFSKSMLHKTVAPLS